jgi:hypothetical protein
VAQLPAESDVIHAFELAQQVTGRFFTFLKRHSFTDFPIMTGTLHCKLLLHTFFSMAGLSVQFQHFVWHTIEKEAHIISSSSPTGLSNLRFVVSVSAAALSTATFLNTWPCVA